MSKLALKAAKAAKTCIDERDWVNAETKSREAISYDPQNYYAHVFLGLSLYNQNKLDECEPIYRRAAELEAAERLAKPRKERPEGWQGLLNVFEKQKRVEDYVEASIHMACYYRDQDERLKSLAAFEKAIAFVKEHGTKAQYKNVALPLQLPGSTLYDYLEGLIPRPDQTYLKLAEIQETEELEKINKEIANRRFRLGAVLNQVETEVRREIWSSSPLEDIYQNIVNWSDDEEIRRTTECKLLQRGYDKLMVLQKENKLQQRLKVESWARGLVILNYPFELAWRIVLEWKDCESIAEHDIAMLQKYVELFPDSGLGIVLTAYFESELSAFPPPPKEEDAEEKKKKEEEEEEEEEEDNSDKEDKPAAEDDDEIPLADRILDRMIEGTRRAPRSILCHRILGDYYLHLEEYESAVEVGRKAQKLIAVETLRTGLSLQRNVDAAIITLGTSLIHFESPKHHPEAKSLFENVLKHNTTHTMALVGLGLILEEQQDYAGGAELLHQALARDPDNTRIKAEAAWCDVLQGQYADGKESLEACLEACNGDDVKSRDLKALVLWRIGMAIWNNEEDMRDDRKGPYAYFIAALQKNQNFAPAYTSLGIFYADIVGDNGRADKCFQKAFELSAGEVEAAERLAKSFADSKEWEFVGIIAQRVADADKKRSVPGKAVSWPHSALGVVELNNQNYPLAIQYFQAALRISPKDFHSWLGLGEAYASSGRYVAALKVFMRAEQLDETNWFAKYMLANVRREMGLFEEACEGYRAVLELRPNEFGVLSALSEALLSMAWKYVEGGFYHRAADSAVECLSVAELILKERADTFNLWKTIGDACILFSWVQSLASNIPREKVVSLLEDDFDVAEFELMADVDQIGPRALEKIKAGEANELDTCLHLGILSYKRAIFASANDRHAHSVAWFNLGTAEYRAYLASPKREMKFRMAAIRCFKRTIKLEPGNHEFWNALGVATGELNPKVAQHAIVRALYINDKNARVWTNLGALYLLMDDLMLANETFSRAQSADPEYVLAWVGQGVIAAIYGEAEQAQELFQHAFEISDHSLIPVKTLYSTATFDTLVSSRADTSLNNLLTPIFALQKLEGQLSDQSPAILQLSVLFDERVGNYSEAADKLIRLCTIYEDAYESTESEADLIRYAHAKSDLARIQLALNQYEDAIENSTLSLELSGDIPALKTCRLSSHLTAGLAQYYQKDMDSSLEMFKSALTESDENPDVICLLSEVLWAKGGDEERDVAREQLFASIEAHPNHISSMLLLGAIGILDSSPEVTDAVVDDLRAFRAREKLPRAMQERIDDLLTAIAQLSARGSEEAGMEAAIAAAASAVFVRPASSGNWDRLAKVAEESWEAAAETALMVAVGGSRDVGEAEELGRALASTGRVGADLRGVFVAPWRREGWEGLKADVKVGA